MGEKSVKDCASGEHVAKFQECQLHMMTMIDEVELAIESRAK